MLSVVKHEEQGQHIAYKVKPFNVPDVTLAPHVECLNSNHSADGRDRPHIASI